MPNRSIHSINLSVCTTAHHVHHPHSPPHHRHPSFKACVVLLSNNLFNLLISVQRLKLPNSNQLILLTFPLGNPITTALHDRSVATLATLDLLSPAAAAEELFSFPAFACAPPGEDNEEPK